MSRAGSTIDVRFRVATPPRAGAIAVIDLFGDIDRCCAAIGMAPVQKGAVALREIAGIDQGVAARWSETHMQIMPHAGPEVKRRILSALESIGAVEDKRPNPREAHPEARDEFEARMLDALSRAASPAAIPILLQQPSRRRQQTDTRALLDRDYSAELNRLLVPPIVVAVGRPNVGKSSLTNAMARAAVSIVSDIPGATRDHVGVTLELPSPRGGVVIRWIDAPGMRAPGDQADPIEREAVSVARTAIAAADLVLLCGDAEHGFVDPAELGLTSHQPWLPVGTRCDLAPVPECDIQTSAATSAGLAELAIRVRRMLISDEALEWTGPWQFDDGETPIPPDAG